MLKHDFGVRACPVSTNIVTQFDNSPHAVYSPMTTSCNAEVLPDLHAFLQANGRHPKIGDVVSPWQYRGWLLLHVQLADFHPCLPGRWQHYMRTVNAGHLLQEAIPQIQFAACASRDGLRMIERSVDLIRIRDTSWSGFSRLVEWLGWGLAVSNERPPLDEDVNEKLYRHFNLEPLLLQPHDYLGAILAERQSGGLNPNAFFPTPHPIVEFMVQVLMNDRNHNVAPNGMAPSGGTDIGTPDGANDSGDGSAKVDRRSDPRLRTVCDPCVGTGRMLLHASNYSYCLYGCDIDPLVTLITKINGALYAPWLSFPFPEAVLGVAAPPPAPARLPLPLDIQPPSDIQLFRTDDRGQGLLNFE